MLAFFSKVKIAKLCIHVYTKTDIMTFHSEQEHSLRFLTMHIENDICDIKTRIVRNKSESYRI